MVMVPYAEPLSDELARNFDEAIERSNGFLMENHGALMGSTEGIKRALELLEMMEAAARSVLVAHMLGGFKAIPRDEVANLDRTLRTRGMAFPGRPGVVGSLVDLMFDE
jgi:L-fuculose-phosphate aldolase